MSTAQTTRGQADGCVPFTPGLLDLAVALFGVTPPEQGIDWQAASCAQADPETWFPEKGQSPRPAKRVCAGCEIVRGCLTDALERRDRRFGVLGGASAEQRERMLKRLADQLGDRPLAGSPELAEIVDQHVVTLGETFLPTPAEQRESREPDRAVA
jgi:WhiB family redox-sensing transcriptional regulator